MERIAFTRDVDEIFRTPLSVYYLLIDEREKIKDPWIRRFEDVFDLEYYAREVEDVELLTAIAIAKEYDVEEVHKKALLCERAQGKKEIILTTAHSCKGLEFDEVEIEHDFPDLCEEYAKESVIGDPPSPWLVDEVNLRYVAITRAKGKLIDYMPADEKSLRNMIEKSKDLYRIINREELKEELKHRWLKEE